MGFGFWIWSFGVWGLGVLGIFFRVWNLKGFGLLVSGVSGCLCFAILEDFGLGFREGGFRL